MSNCPLERVISLEQPANNGEPPIGDPIKDGSIPTGNPVGSRERELLDPVTTESESSRWRSLPQGKSIDAIRRRPFETHLPSYISGYVDGEGCFCVSLRPQPRIRVGWEVRPSFSVSQNGDRAELIMMLPEYFGCGSIRPDRSDKTLKFEVRSLKDLVERVNPFFERFGLLSSKQSDFDIFNHICKMMVRGAHLQQDGIEAIADLATKMNSSGIRKYTADVIKASFKGEGIVCAPRDRGST